MAMALFDNIEQQNNKALTKHTKIRGSYNPNVSGFRKSNDKLMTNKIKKQKQPEIVLSLQKTARFIYSVKQLNSLGLWEELCTHLRGMVSADDKYLITDEVLERVKSFQYNEDDLKYLTGTQFYDFVNKIIKKILKNYYKNNNDTNRR